jgi:hypothetical protein
VSNTVAPKRTDAVVDALIADFLSKKPITRPTPTQKERYAKEEQIGRAKAAKAAGIERFRWRAWHGPDLAQEFATTHGMSAGTKILELEGKRIAGDQPSPAAPAPPPPAQDRATKPTSRLYRKCEECQTKLPNSARSDARFCGERCKKAASRRRTLDDANRKLFKAQLIIKQNTLEAARFFEVYRFSACDLQASAGRLGITDVSFVPTPNGIVAIKTNTLAGDNGGATMLPKTCKRQCTFVEGSGAPTYETMPGLREQERSTSDADLIAMIQNAKQQPFGLSILDQERKQRYHAALDSVLDGPERQLLVFTFDNDVIGTELYFEGDPKWEPWVPLSPTEEAAECARIAMIDKIIKARWPRRPVLDQFGDPLRVHPVKPWWIEDEAD